MGTDKRQRQKELRAAKRAAELVAAQRARRIRLIRNFGILVAVVFGAAILLSLLSRGDGTAATTTAATTTSSTTPGDTTSSTLPGAETPAATNLALFRAQPTACGAGQPPAPEQLSFAAAEDMAIPSDATVTVTMSTSCGDLILELDPAAAPSTVNSFVFLAEQGYFDGTAFHRLDPTFVLQGGDPTGTGSGGPGYTVPDEFPAESAYTAGTLAMANAGPGTTGSQFFVMFEDRALDPVYTIFGKLVGGQDVLDLIKQVPVGLSVQGERSRPLESVYIDQVTVEIT